MPAQLIHNWEQFWCGVLQYQCNHAGVVHWSRGCTEQGLQHKYREWRPERSLIHTCKYILNILTLFFSFWSVIGSNFSICMEHILDLGSPFGYMENELLPALHFHSCYWSSWIHQNHRIIRVGTDPQRSLSPTPSPTQHQSQALSVFFHGKINSCYHKPICITYCVFLPLHLSIYFYQAI